MRLTDDEMVEIKYMLVGKEYDCIPKTLIRKAVDTIEELQQERKDIEDELYNTITKLRQQLSDLQGKAMLVMDMPKSCSGCNSEFPFPVSENVHYESHCGLLYGQDSSGHWLMKCIRKDKRECERLPNCPLRQY
jgi:hypothetical protein